MISPPAGRTAFASALALLTGRALTVGELAERLRRKGYDVDTIAETAGRLLDLGYLDDRRTAVAWADHAVQARGFGPRRLREGLVKRHLPPDLVDEIVAGLFEGGEEVRFALAVLAKWERARGAACDTAGRHAAYGHLRRRGFSGAAARAALFNRQEIE